MKIWESSVVCVLPLACVNDNYTDDNDILLSIEQVVIRVDKN